MEFLDNVGIFTICIAVVCIYKKVQEVYQDQPHEEDEPLHSEKNKPNGRGLK